MLTWTVVILAFVLVALLLVLAPLVVKFFFSGRTNWTQFSLAEYLTKGGKVYSSPGKYRDLIVDVEKIFSNGKDVVVGVKFSRSGVGVERTIRFPYLIDVNGTIRDNVKAFELKIDKTKKLRQYENYFGMNVSEGESLRVIFVFKDLLIEEVRKGSLYIGELFSFELETG